jgi:hypothetical protein
MEMDNFLGPPALLHKFQRGDNMNSKLAVGVIVGAFFALVLCSNTAYAGGAGTDPCSLLTQAQVNAVLGVNVNPAKRLAPTMCGWSAPNQPKKVALLISNARAFGYAKTPIVDSEKAAPANGVCDDAVYSFPAGEKSGSATSLFVKKGSSYFTVHVYGFPDQAKVMEMEKTLALDACSNL